MSTKFDYRRAAAQGGIAKTHQDPRAVDPRAEAREAVDAAMMKVRGWRDKLTEDDYDRLYKRGWWAVMDRLDGESARTVAKNAVHGTAARWIHAKARASRPPTSVAAIERVLEAKGMPHGGPTTVVAEQVANGNARDRLLQAVKRRRDESGGKYPPTKLVLLKAAPPERNRINKSIFNQELVRLTRLGARREDADRWLHEAADTLRQQGEAASSDPDSDDDDMPNMSRRR